MIELLNHIARLWWAWTASMFWQVGLLILLIGCIDLLIRKWAWPQLRYALWSLILVKLILPPTLSLPSGVVPELRPRAATVLQWMNSDKPAGAEKPTAISDFGFGPRIEVRGDKIADSTLDVGPQFRGFVMSPGGIVAIEDLGDNHVAGFQPAIRGRDALDTSQHDATQAAPATNPQSAIVNPQLEWPFYAMIIWLFGTLILGIWLFLRLHSVAGRQGYRAAAASLPQSFYNHLADCATRLGLRRLPRVAVAKRLTSPAVFGVLSPVLLVPQGYLSKLSRRDTEHMLLHELAHIKRGDLVMHGLYLLLQVVYWYNPLLWLVRRHLHHLRELSCDGTVAELLRERTLAYRQTLLETARRMLTMSVEPGLGLLGLFEDSNYLLVRLHWLTKPTWRYCTMKRVIVATIAILMFACVLPMAQGQQAAPQDATHVSNNSAVPVHTESSNNQQAQDQLAQQIAALQAQLAQMMAQQQELQKQLKALAEQRSQTGRPLATRREALQPQPPREPAPMAVAPTQPEPPALPGANENKNLTPEARDDLKRAQEQVRRAQDEVKRAEKEAARAQREAERAQRDAERTQAESARSVQDQKHQGLAQSMQAYGDQMKGWSQSEQMKKWQADMNAWGQKMEQWGQEFGRRQAAAVSGSGSDSEGRAMPPMPAMPAMPAMPQMPPMPPMPAMPPISVTVPEVPMPAVEPPVPPAVPGKQDGREEAVSRLEQAVDLSAGQLLEVANEIGSISVLGGDEPGCKIVATVKGKAETKEGAQRIVDQVKLVVTPSDDKVRVSLTKPEVENQRKGPGYEVTLEVRVPRKVQIKVSQAVGSIRLTGLRGSVDASAKVGSIRATDVSGRVALNADVGSIEFVAPKDFSAKVEAKANIGSIQSDFPIDVVKSRGPATGSSASGTMGGGEGELSLKTNVGSIRIRAQGAEPRRAERSRPEPKPRPEPRPAEPRPEPQSDNEF